MTDCQTDRTSHSTIKPRTDKVTSAGMIISSAQTDMTKWPLTCCTVDLNHKRESWGRGDRGGNDRTRAQLQCLLAWDKRHADLSRFTASLELSRSSQKMHIPEDRVVTDTAAATMIIMCGSFRASRLKARRQKCDKDLDWTGPDLGLALDSIHQSRPEYHLSDLFWISSSKTNAHRGRYYTWSVSAVQSALHSPIAISLWRDLQEAGDNNALSCLSFFESSLRLSPLAP